MRALLNTAGLGMERQNREFLSLPVVVVWFIRIFPPIPFVSARGEMEGRRRDLPQRHSLRKGSGKQKKKKGYVIPNVWHSSGREVNSSIKEGREKG
jgi:hypothetical protein